MIPSMQLPISKEDYKMEVGIELGMESKHLKHKMKVSPQINQRHLVQVKKILNCIFPTTEQTD